MFYYLAAQKNTYDIESLCVYVVHPELNRQVSNISRTISQHFK